MAPRHRSIAALVLLSACATLPPERPIGEIIGPVIAAGRARMDSLALVAGATEAIKSVTPAAPPPNSRLREVPLTYLDSLGATSLLQSLFASPSIPVTFATPSNPVGFATPSNAVGFANPPNPAGGLRFAVLGRRSMVLLSGDTSLVAAAAAALARADQPNPHILLEALVIELDRQTLLALGLSLDSLAKGTIKNGAINIGDVENPAVVFTSTLGTNAAQTFRASIQALESEQRAHVVARPFVSARSGDSAGITIGRDRYIVTGSAAGLGNLGSQQVTTGVILHFVPVALPDSQVLVALNVEQSVFIPTEGNEAVQVDKQTANTRMQVRSGQTIVIGGLTLQRDERFVSGLPWFARIPVIGSLFGQRGTSVNDQDVIILITPWVWQPGTLLPPR